MKRGLSSVIEDEWVNFLEVGNLMGKRWKVVMKCELRDIRLFVILDSILIGNCDWNVVNSVIDV